MLPEPKDEPTTSLGWGERGRAFQALLPTAHGAGRSRLTAQRGQGPPVGCQSLSHLATTKLLSSWSPL